MTCRSQDSPDIVGTLSACRTVPDTSKSVCWPLNSMLAHYKFKYLVSCATSSLFRKDRRTVLRRKAENRDSNQADLLCRRAHRLKRQYQLCIVSSPHHVYQCLCRNDSPFETRNAERMVSQSLSFPAAIMNIHSLRILKSPKCIWIAVDTLKSLIAESTTRATRQADSHELPP